MAIPHRCNLLNDYELGGAVILLRPDVKVSLDGRNDMYGRALLSAGVQLLRDVPGTDARLNAAHVDCVLTLSSDNVVGRLAQDPDWHVAGHDAVRTLIVRNGYRS
jgi:hypothetical protein